jgi:hypothetical protein
MVFVVERYFPGSVLGSPAQLALFERSPVDRIVPAVTVQLERRTT